MKTALVLVSVLAAAVAVADDGMVSVSDVMKYEAQINESLVQSAIAWAVAQAEKANTKAKEYAFVRLSLVLGYEPAAAYSLALLGSMTPAEAKAAKELAETVVRSESGLLAGMLIPGARNGSF